LAGILGNFLAKILKKKPHYSNPLLSIFVGWYILWEKEITKKTKKDDY